MAKKSGKRGAAGRARASRGDAASRIVDAALDLAAAGGWRGVSLADIAAASGLSVAELRDIYPSKSAVLGAFIARIDEATLAGGKAGDGSTRERLFELFMRRFDALNRRRAAVVAILRDGPRDPVSMLCLAPRLVKSVAAIAGAAGVETGGLCGPARVKALTAVYLWALRVWFDDDNADLGRTMAALDKALARAEMLAQSLPRPPRRAAAGAA
ncbi:MAG: TetR family transcriptional regulator [Rhodospirillales bacterium]|nr:TetR family transcriptional regulator [Rhodospirillales bacterium]